MPADAKGYWSSIPALPEPALLRAKRDLSAYGARLEFHLHLLASSAAEREFVLADLAVHSA